MALTEGALEGVGWSSSKLINESPALWNKANKAQRLYLDIILQLNLCQQKPVSRCDMGLAFYANVLLPHHSISDEPKECLRRKLPWVQPHTTTNNFIIFKWTPLLGRQFFWSYVVPIYVVHCTLPQLNIDHTQHTWAPFLTATGNRHQVDSVVVQATNTPN